AMFGMVLVVGWNMVQPAGPVAGPGQGGMGASAGAANGAATTDITQMSPREAADRLFNRVMTTASAGDTAGAQAFLPMAIGAYERAMPLDMDGYFHMALLQITGAEYDGALAVAQEILDVYPDHLLGLASAGDAAAGAGRMDEAREYFTHIIRVFDAEVGRALPEYEGHQSYLTELKARAEAFVSAH
ncbi:MAG: hypothetical protein OEZ37_11485, partial [Gemmatimonadota bacterium]|nr:hypothetical protein [Gemmatimonadota bacterium]